MSHELFAVGDYVEFLGGDCKGEEGVVWEVGETHLAIIREDDCRQVAVPYYVPIESAIREIRLVRLRQEPDEPHSQDWIPKGAQLALQTLNRCPQSGYDYEEIVVWSDARGSNLEVFRTRLTGVLGLSDGTCALHRRLNEAEWKEIKQRLDDLMFWYLPYDDGIRTTDSYEYWTLLGYHEGKQHEVIRSHSPNDIESFCRLLFSVAEQPELCNGRTSS